jgi:hypothetical protein
MMVSTFYRSTIIFMVTAAMAFLVVPTTSASTTRQLKGQGPPQGKRGKDRSSSSDTHHRMVLEARVTLVNLDMDVMTPEEVVFFENTFLNVFNELRAGQDDKDEEEEGNNNNNGLRIRTLIVEDVAKGGGGRRDDSGNRGLRGADATTRSSSSASTDTAHTPKDRSLSYYVPGDYFDVRVLLEITGACRLCGGYSDDDDRRELSMTDDAAHRLLESMLLDRLRSGPFREFEDLDGCSIIYIME